MKKRLEPYLKKLRIVFENSRKKLVEIEAQASSIRHTLLCISGAIQVLEEDFQKRTETAVK